jgi:hypothetical protein
MRRRRMPVRCRGSFITYPAGGRRDAGAQLPGAIAEGYSGKPYVADLSPAGLTSVGSLPLLICDGNSVVCNRGLTRGENEAS